MMGRAEFYFVLDIQAFGVGAQVKFHANYHFSHAGLKNGYFFFSFSLRKSSVKNGLSICILELNLQFLNKTGIKTHNQGEIRPDIL